MLPVPPWFTRRRALYSARRRVASTNAAVRCTGAGTATIFAVYVIVFIDDSDPCSVRAGKKECLRCVFRCVPALLSFCLSLQPFLLACQVACAAVDFGIMPPASRLDDPSALADFLSSISAPDTLAAAIKSAGFHTLGSLAFALSDPSDPDEVMQFIRVILKIPDADASATFRPDASCLRRTILEACSIAPPRAASANAPSQLLPAAPAASGSHKLTAAEFLALRKDYLKKYPGELLTPANTPSVEMLSLIKQHHEAGQSVWVPWRQRTSESDFLQWEESRRPRSDRQMLRSLLDMPNEVDGPTYNFRLDGPSESVLRRCLDLFATALALVDLVHLATIKRFNDKFFTLATTPPSDTTLRAPVLQEVVHADRAVWMAVSALVRDQAWSLTDSLNEVGFCRHDMAPLLQPRPKPPRVPQPPPGPGKLNPRKRITPGDPPPAPPSGADLPAPKGAPKGKAKAKGKASPSKPGPMVPTFV